MPFEVTFHCSHCSTPLPADDQEFGFFRDDNDQAVCIHCFNICCDEDRMEISLDECFEALLTRMSDDGVPFNTALRETSFDYGLSGDAEGVLQTMYQSLSL
jgi:hypothetical protein